MKKKQINEINIIQKPNQQIRWRIGLVYPNSYSIGMSGLSIKLLYHLLNQNQNIYAERVFMSNLPGPPKSIETGKTLQQFNILAFSVQFELDFVNVIRMLQSSNIPVYAKDRTSDHPIIIAGGPTITTNPEPLLDVVDIIFMGDFENVSANFLSALNESKYRSLVDDILKIPGFYSAEEPRINRKPVLTQHLDDINYPVAQVRPINPNIKKKGALDGYFLQISRGCTHSCHFCLIGKIFRPHRERSLPVLKHLINSGAEKTQTRFFSLIGSSTADHSQINDLITFFLENKLRFTLPSIRVDTGLEILELLKKAGQKSLTIAPESGSEEIRFKIGKRISNEQIKDFVLKADKYAIHQLKMYFILGLTQDMQLEMKEIMNLIDNLSQLKTSIDFNVSVNPLIPKYGTKLANNRINYHDMKQEFNFLKLNLRKKVKFKSFPLHWASIQAILSIGGRETTTTLVDVASLGGSYSSWKKALEDDPTEYYLKNYK